MKNWFAKLHEWGLQWANTKWGVWALFICAFADSSILGLPTPMLFVALILLNRTKTYKYALFGTLGSLLGAIAGYYIGHFAWLNQSGGFTGLAQFLFDNIPGFSETVYQNIHNWFAAWDFWILFIASLLPVPYKIFSISSGVFNINFLMFCIATFISQGIKFYLLAFLTIKLGPGIKKLFELKLKPIAYIATASVAVAIVLFKAF